MTIRVETDEEQYSRLARHLRIRECYPCLECTHNGELDGCLADAVDWEKGKRFPPELDGCDLFELDDDAHKGDSLPVVGCSCDHCERNRERIAGWILYLRRGPEVIDLSKRRKATKQKQRKRRKRKLKRDAKLQRGALKRARRAPIAKRRGASP